MFNIFTGHTADEVWRAAAAAFRDQNIAEHHEGRGGATREILHAALSIGDPRQRWILSRTPAINPAFAIAEVVWIISGRNDSQFLTRWNPGLAKFQGSGPTFHGAYGHRLRRHFSVDQLSRAADALSQNPASRQIVLQIWDADIDLPNQAGQPRSPDIPCNVSAMLKVRGGVLEWMQILRSNDLHRGLPYNVVQFTMLQEILAGWIGVDVGTYNHLSDSLHVYDAEAHYFTPASHPVLPLNTDSISLPKPESDRIWSVLEGRLDEMAQRKDLREAEWSQLINVDDVPESFRNLFVIAAADDARRRGWVDAALTVASHCSNPLLKLAWDRWERRQRSRLAPA